MKTRAKKINTKSSSSAETRQPQLKELEASESNPPQVFILPKDLSDSSRVLSLPNPATSTPSRYIICPDRGCFEFTRIGGPKKACRSWLLAPDHTDESTDDEGYVLQSPDLMLATPIDPLFMVLPVLAEDGEDGGKQTYLSPSDYLMNLAERAPHFKQLLYDDHGKKLERMFETRILTVCDALEAGDETLYRLSHSKLLQQLVTKAQAMIARGLPASMEEHFVKQALAEPLLSIKREESGFSVVETEEDAASGAGESESQSTFVSTPQDSQTSSVSAASVSTAASTVTTTPDELPSISTDIIHLLRLRTALNFILQSYIAPSLRTTLQSMLASKTSTTDFSPLDKHLASLAERKKEAQALRSLSDNISRKRAYDEEDEDKAETKRRKKEEEEAKKKNISRGVQQLKKADTSGMKKLSSFFIKAPAKKA